jgi:hypothetical protein
MTKTRERPTTIRDLLEDDARVICTEGFRPWMGGAIERGRYYTLDAPIVRQNPQFFAVVIPLADVLAGEIER